MTTLVKWACRGIIAVISFFGFLADISTLQQFGVPKVLADILMSGIGRILLVLAAIAIAAWRKELQSLADYLRSDGDLIVLNLSSPRQVGEFPSAGIVSDTVRSTEAEKVDPQVILYFAKSSSYAGFFLRNLSKEQSAFNVTARVENYASKTIPILYHSTREPIEFTEAYIDSFGYLRINDSSKLKAIAVDGMPMISGPFGLWFWRGLIAIVGNIEYTDASGMQYLTEYMIHLDRWYQQEITVEFKKITKHGVSDRFSSRIDMETLNASKDKTPNPEANG